MPTALPFDPSPFIHREDTLAAQLGVDRAWIRSHRKRENYGSLWSFGPNRSLLWSDTGRQFLAEQLEKSAPPASPDPRRAVENPAGPSRPPVALLPEKTGALEVLVAIRTNFSNKRIIQAMTTWKETVTVIGVKGPLWWPGFLLLARENSRGVWEFEGNPQHPELGRRQPRGRTDNAWPRKPLHGAA